MLPECAIKLSGDSFWNETSGEECSAKCECGAMHAKRFNPAKTAANSECLGRCTDPNACETDCTQQCPANPTHAGHQPDHLGMGISQTAAHADVFSYRAIGTLFSRFGNDAPQFVF